MMLEHEYPILEFDPEKRAILEPKPPALSEPPPTHAVACFFQEVLADLVEKRRLKEIGSVGSEMGVLPLYVLESDGSRLLVYHPGVGAPLAAGLTEEVIVCGVRKIIACGGAGALDPSMLVGHPVILTAAVRDEGTSYHYLPPARWVEAHPAAITALKHVFEEKQLPFQAGLSWTTDGYYRETAARREARIKAGCLVVEMEAAAFFAVARFRQIVMGQVVYCGDLVVPEGWDYRGWNRQLSTREQLFWLAVEACLAIEE